jgi:ADP-ribosylglycohydrolase
MKKIIPFLLLWMACQRPITRTNENTYVLRSPMLVPVDTNIAVLPLTREQYYDKVLGALVGSAIGDAMGAPTEMWHRYQIDELYGFVDTLDAVIREGSPEGPWDDNLPQGGTTDDTRWKYLMGGFLLQTAIRPDSLDPRAFAAHIVSAYQRDVAQLKQVDAFAPEPFEQVVTRMAWLQEWAKVAQPFAKGDWEGYNRALHKFYGGEMACAGMLYAPLIGAFYPAQPEKAYKEAHRLALFDLGYARDITGLTAAMVSEAMRAEPNFTDVMSVSRSIDPEHYFNSRLIGRVAYRIYTDAKKINTAAKRITLQDRPKQWTQPLHFKGDTLECLQMQHAYALLDQKLQDIPFHAAEIQLIHLTAMEFGQGDFQKTITFIVNYGRDNDTVAAVTGSVLGAFWGFERLPVTWRNTVLTTNRTVLGIDLERLAGDLTRQAFGR